MLSNAYADVTQGSSDVAREQESIAFDDGLALMEVAQGDPENVARRLDAARHMQILWRYLIKDLSNPANDLSDELKANLVSIGLWSLREVNSILAERKSDWAALIDINRTVREGLSS